MCFASFALVPSNAGAVANGFPSIPGPDWSAYIAVNRTPIGYFFDEATCSGSLISRYWVLTAAHCVTDETTTSTSRSTPEGELVQQSWRAYDPNDLDLAVGRGDLDDGSAGFDTGVTEIHVHPQYKVYGVRRTGIGAICGLDCRRLQFADNAYDLALLKLETAAPVGTEIVSLASTRPVAGSVATMYGYGRTESGDDSRELRITRFGSYELTACSSRDTDSECALGSADVSSRLRRGDSGGPWLAFLDGRLRQIAVHSVNFGDAGDAVAGTSTVGALGWLSRTANLPRSSSDAGSVGMALAIDSSGSMTSNDPSDRRLSAAEAYLTAAGVADAVGIVDFDSVARVASPALNPRTDREALVAAIRTIDSSGGTNIGAGVARACETLQGAGSHGYKAAILLTDGFGSYQNENSCFTQNGWKLFTFGLGSSVDAPLLTRIAEETGGRYRPLPTTGDLVCEFQQVRALAAGGTARDCTPSGTISPGQRISRVVSVGRRLLQMVFSVSWPGSDIDLELTAPSGRVIRTDTDAFDVVATEGDTFESIAVADPELGEWTVDVVAIDVDPLGESFSLSTVDVPLTDLPPTARFTSDASGSLGEIAFDAAGSTDDQGIVDYIWDFGDGFAGSGPEVRHAYREPGTYEVRLTVVDGTGAAEAVTDTVTVAALNAAPDVSAVRPSPAVLWPPSGALRIVRLDGATDPDGDPVKLTITGVEQDERPGRVVTAVRCPEGDQVALRAERSAHGDGRIYRVSFTAEDGRGGVSQGVVKIAVPHDRARSARDSGPPYFSARSVTGLRRSCR